MELRLSLMTWIILFKRVCEMRHHVLLHYFCFCLFNSSSMIILCILSFVKHIAIETTAKNNEKITIPFAIQKSQYIFVINTKNIVNNISNAIEIIDIPNTHVPNELTIIERRRTIFAKTQISILYNISLYFARYYSKCLFIRSYDSALFILHILCVSPI